MAGRFDIATGKPPPPSDPNRAEVQTLKPQEISETIIKKLAPKNGDVFFISSDQMTAADWEQLRHTLNSTLKNLHVTCGIVLSKYEFEVKKEALGDVVRVEFGKDTPAPSAVEKYMEEITQASLKDNRPTATGAEA